MQKLRIKSGTNNILTHIITKQLITTGTIVQRISACTTYQVIVTVVAIDDIAEPSR